MKVLGPVYRFMVGDDAIQNKAVLDRLAIVKNSVVDDCILPVSGEISVHGARANVSSELFQDLQLDLDVAPHVNVARTVGGKAYVRALLKNPIADRQTLSDRQACLRRLASKGAFVERLETLASLEPHVVWMFRNKDDDAVSSLYEMAYFTSWFLRGLNRTPWALTGLNLYRIAASPLIGILSPVVYFIVPFLVLRLKLSLKVPFTTYIRFMLKSMWIAGASSMKWTRYVSLIFTIVFYFQNVFTSIEISTTLRKVCRQIMDRIGLVHQFFDEADELDAAMWDDDVSRAWFPHVATPPATSAVCPTKLPDRGSPMACCNFGKHLKAYRRFDFEVSLAALQRVYAMDALLSVVDWNRRESACWVEYASEKCIDIRGMRHPALPAHSVVKNSWKLRYNVILTGPNAGGKSTLLKSLLVTTLMAQTLTTAPCDKCRMIPFEYISSHINVPDVNGKESLFEAEMRRSKRNIDMLAGLTDARHGLVVMDEIFSSTNPVEGISGAYAIAKRMAECPHALTVISTHFVYLCRLAKETDGKFQNFCMPISSKSPYKLQRGVSRQYVALELLRERGFDAGVIDEAIKIKKRLLAIDG